MHLYYMFNGSLDKFISSGRPGSAGACWTIERAQKDVSSVKIILLQSRSLFSFAQANRVLACFSISFGFFIILRHFMP